MPDTSTSGSALLAELEAEPEDGKILKLARGGELFLCLRQIPACLGRRPPDRAIVFQICGTFSIVRSSISRRSVSTSGSRSFKLSAIRILANATCANGPRPAAC